MAPTFNQNLIDLLKQQKEFLLEYGFIQNDFDIDSWLAPGYLAEALKEYNDNF